VLTRVEVLLALPLSQGGFRIGALAHRVTADGAAIAGAMPDDVADPGMEHVSGLRARPQQSRASRIGHVMQTRGPAMAKADILAG